MGWATSNRTLGPFFSSDAMARIFSDEARIQAMLDVEAALARAQADLGLIPAEAVSAIAAAAMAKNFDLDQLGQDVRKTGNLAIPLVKALTALVAARDAEAARWVHWGATSQDIIDTGLVLQMRDALASLDTQLEGLGNRLAALAEDHAETPIAGRTLMQQAVPTTLGCKIGGWLAALARCRQSLCDRADRGLVLQFGGAAGNLASLAPNGIALSEALAADLKLKLPDVPWHGQRDGVAGTGVALAVLLGSLGKMARDLALMAQTEIGEFSEPSGEGRGGSSAMPHKANPVACARIIAAADRAPGLGGWQAEWEVLPELFRLASAALEAARFAVENGRFDTGRMRVNLDVTSGLVMAEAAAIALARKLGKSSAHRLIERASAKGVEDKRSLRGCLEADPEIAPHLDQAALDALFTPENHLGAAPEFARRAAASWRRQAGANWG